MQNKNDTMVNRENTLSIRFNYVYCIFSKHANI